MEKYERIVAMWKRKSIETDAELAETLNEHSIAFAYNSSKIENDRVDYYDTREIFEHDGVTNYTGDLRTLFELRNAREAYEFFLESFGKCSLFNEEFIMQLQEHLTKNTHRYKKHDYVTGRNEVGALPEDVHEEMAELMEELQDIDEKNALTAAAYFHAKFENIHPFADGNGRTGRLAMNYFLVMHNHPPVIIHEEDRKEYYQSLEAWDTKQDLNTLKQFLKEQTEKTWERQLQRAEKNYPDLD